MPQNINCKLFYAKGAAMDFQALGQEIRQRRRQRRVSQTLMAEHLTISRATLNALETGRAGDIGIKKVIKILDYLGMELSLREKSPFPTFEELRDE
jgi:transcriptional regulator with XRE-family HTH domain